MGEFEGWEIVKRLRVGTGQAEVFQVRSRQRAPYELGALKVFKKRGDDAKAEREVLNCLKAEIRALKQNIPGMLRLLASSEEGGWIITEYQPNGTLEDNPSLFKGKASLALRAFRPLVQAVAALHTQGILHRDIKPANVFVGSETNLILGDLGIVYRPDQQERVTQTNERVGPYDYMPIWADLGERLEKVKPNFDVYMLGKLLWCMVAGRLKLPREFYRREGFNLTEAFPDDPHMDFINSILDSCVVEKAENCLPNAKELLLMVDGYCQMTDGVPPVREKFPIKADPVAWFRRNFPQTKEAPLVSTCQLFSIGEAAVLHVSPKPVESIHVLLDRWEVPEPKFGDLEHCEVWKKQRKKLREQFQAETGRLLGQRQTRETQEELLQRMDRMKCAPIGLRLPLKDYPVARIRYTPVLYSAGRSFATAVLEDTALWKKLVDQGVDYEDEKTPPDPWRPGLLHTNIVVLTTEANGLPHVILGQRTSRQGPDIGLFQGLWFATVGEQVEDADHTIEKTIRRALEEELLGPQAYEVPFGIVALFLEIPTLNLGVGVICSTGLSFDEIHDLWPSCMDHAEHSQIVALPLDEAIVKGCIHMGEITDQARRSCKIKREFNSTQSWKLHPTSGLGLALALWAVESQ